MTKIAQSSSALYTQLTDRQLAIDKRLDLIEEMASTQSKQMIFDWLSGLVVNRKKSGLDSMELVHRVWKQLILGLDEQIVIKSSFVKALIETLGNENGELNNSAIECCLFIGNQGKELDYKYEQLVELLRIVLTKYQEHEQLLTMVLNKYWTTIRVQGNINKVFVDLCKQLLAPLLDIRAIYPSLASLVDDILKHIVFHRTWITAYRSYIQSISNKKSISCPVTPLFIALESLIISENPNVIDFLPLTFRHCINLLDPEKVSDIFELLIQLNTWLGQMKNDDLYIQGIRRILQVLDEKHLIDHLLTESLEERFTSWMKDILFKRTQAHQSSDYAHLSVVCLHLHPTLIEASLSDLIQLFLSSNQSLSIFLIGYLDLYSRMRSLPKLTKRLTIALDKSIVLPDNVLEHYRKCISQCTHTLIDEIWSSLLENSTDHLIIIQLISALLNGYRLFDLNIPREILIQQNQLKYQRTLEKLRGQIDETKLTSSNSDDRICYLQCYLSLGWFSLCLLSFSSSVPSVDDPFNHNGPFLSPTQWDSLQSDADVQPILFSLACQRIYRSLAVTENDLDPKLIENMLQFSSSSSIFNQLEPFFDFLPKNKQLKLIKSFIEHPKIDRSWFISNEDRLRLVLQALIEMNIHDQSQTKKRRKLDFDDEADSFYDYLNNKSAEIDGKILSIFSSIHFHRIQSMGILLSIAWLAMKTSPSSFESMQILVEIISSSKTFPSAFIRDLLDFTLAQNHEPMLDQVLIILDIRPEYQTILQRKSTEIIDEMKFNEDFLNIRLLEKYLLLFAHNRSNELSPIIDRLINSSSHSSISYSELDTRYILAMIILNSFTTFEKYSKFLRQTWKALMKETNGVNQVVMAYAKEWKKVLKEDSTMDDVDAIVRCLKDEYELIQTVIQGIEQKQFKEWLEKTVEEIKIPLEDLESCRKGFEVLQTLAHCSLEKEKNLYLMTKINSVITQCGSLLIDLPNEHPGYAEMVSSIFTFGNEVLSVKKSQLRSQVALSLLQCCLHLSPHIFILNHSNVCKLLSLLIKHHTTTLCKHVPTIEMIIKLLLQAIVSQAKESQEKHEQLIEAARNTTKLAAHLIEQCKDDFRSTIVYVLIDYVHLLSKGVFISPLLKKTLNNVAFELFRISGERVEQYSGQISIAERELLKQLHQQFKQYHMFKGTV